ncbi:MAG TPA: glycosyltransferase family 39 protein [Chroococcales cyanobacterium]
MGAAGRIFKQITTTSPPDLRKAFNWLLPPNWLRVMIVSLLILGLFFRFVNLDRKVYWVDELYTSFRVSGYTEPAIIQQVSENKIFTANELQKYQHLNSDKNVTDTIEGLITEEPQLTPFYFVMARYWARLFGDSIASMRSLPAVTSLLVFPCVYWLCLELFESSLVGWIAIALIAVSPFHLVYAQEARPYTLWILTTLISSAVLLRARRVNTWRHWGIYAATVALGLYSYLFFAFVAISHGIYVAVMEGLRRTQVLKGYLIATIAGFIAFVPWMLIVIYYLPQIIRSTPEQSKSRRQAFSEFVKTWSANISGDFFDLGLRSGTLFDSPLPITVVTIATMFAVLILVGYSIYFLCRQTPQRVWLFVITLMAVNALALALPDIILGGRRSFLPRYFVPCHLGIQLAVAYLLSSKISYTPMRRRQQKIWQIILITVLSVGVLSDAVYSPSTVWWQKKTNGFNPELAPVVNQASKPLVIREMPRNFPPHNFFTIVSLSYWVEPKARYQVVFDGTMPTVSSEFSDVFIIDPSQKLLDKLLTESTIQLYPVEPVKNLPVFKLVKI